MKKSPYIFNQFDFDAYRNGNKAAGFMPSDLKILQFGLNRMGREDIENELLQYPDCKELKKALKLYKLLDKYAK